MQGDEMTHQSLLGFWRLLGAWCPLKCYSFTPWTMWTHKSFSEQILIQSIAAFSYWSQKGAKLQIRSEWDWAVAERRGRSWEVSAGFIDLPFCIACRCHLAWLWQKNLWLLVKDRLRFLPEETQQKQGQDYLWKCMNINKLRETMPRAKRCKKIAII